MMLTTSTASLAAQIILFPARKTRKSFATFTCLSAGIDYTITDIIHNKVLVATAVSGAIGQLLKPSTAAIFYGKKFDFTAAFQAGGFPSTHSSTAVATAATLGLERGFSDDIFGLAVVYACLTMYDAQGVRREVGNHAKELNNRLTKSLESFEKNEILKESIGHTEIEVLAGGLWGLFVSLLIYKCELFS